jgi:glycosyltransferase involved in cell wall biosynthesis
VISSRAGAAADILENGRNGLLLETVSGPAIADAVERVRSDPEGARVRARAGRRRVERDFSLAANAERLAGLSSVLLRGHGSGRGAGGRR